MNNCICRILKNVAVLKKKQIVNDETHFCNDDIIFSATTKYK